jgi:hypothetical protein
MIGGRGPIYCLPLGIEGEGERDLRPGTMAWSPLTETIG